ncbi:hypothetical protein [Flavobacterium wongokense]|nr:hypothetical protein [Flavobacterium sp. WG47]MCF6133186.1 hypothetical protein [Flavobacterium sp. WG47]
MKRSLVYRSRYLLEKNLKSVAFLAVTALIVCLVYLIILIAEYTSDIG